MVLYISKKLNVFDPKFKLNTFDFMFIYEIGGSNWWRIAHNLYFFLFLFLFYLSTFIYCLFLKKDKYK